MVCLVHAGCSGSRPGLQFSAAESGMRSVVAPSDWLQSEFVGEPGRAVVADDSWENGRNDVYQPRSAAMKPGGWVRILERDTQRTIHGRPWDTYTRRSWSIGPHRR